MNEVDGFAALAAMMFLLAVARKGERWWQLYLVAGVLFLVCVSFWSRSLELRAGTAANLECVQRMLGTLGK